MSITPWSSLTREAGLNGVEKELNSNLIGRNRRVVRMSMIGVRGESYVPNTLYKILKELIKTLLLKKPKNSERNNAVYWVRNHSNLKSLREKKMYLRENEMYRTLHSKWLVTNLVNLECH